MKASILTLALMASTANAATVTTITADIPQLDEPQSIHRLMLPSTNGELVWTVNCMTIEGKQITSDNLTYKKDISIRLIANMQYGNSKTGVVNFPQSNMVASIEGQLFDADKLSNRRAIEVILTGEAGTTKGLFDLTGFKAAYIDFTKRCGG